MTSSSSLTCSKLRLRLEAKFNDEPKEENLVPKSHSSNFELS